MIASLRGLVEAKENNETIVNVSGVGYRVAVSSMTLTQLPSEGGEVFLRIRTVVREDAFDLFGFLDRAEEEMFLLLTSVSHVGPKLALMVLSGLPVNELAVAIGKGEVARLTKIHGVGKKTAERLVLELKEKVKALSLTSSAPSAHRDIPGQSDLVSALVNLGYREPQAEKAAQVAGEQLGDAAAFDQLFREALKHLRTGGA